MRLWIVLAVLLSTALNVCAVQEKISLGPKDNPYNVTFNLANCKNCSVNVTQPIKNPDSDIYAFLIESGNNSCMVWMEQYKELQDATLPRKPNFEMTNFCTWLNATAKKTTISGRYAWLVQGKSPRDGEDRFVASFWLDDKKCECGPVSVGKTYVEIASHLPANATNSFLQSLEFKK